MAQTKISVVTGTRADYGLLVGLMREIEQAPEFDLQLIVSAMHLSPEFGLTYQQIEKDGFRIDEKVEMLVSGDTPVSIAKSMGLGVIGFIDAFARLQPDLVVILGDRFEALSAAQAAMVAKIPIAHIHGGEVTEGAVDESIRHAITKMSHLHFVSTAEFRKRVVQLGEQPQNVFVSGAPGIDNILRLQLLGRADFQKSINFELAEQTFLVTYHPVTLAETSTSNDMANLFRALDHFRQASLIITYPNADAEGRQLIKQIETYAALDEDRVYITPSLGQSGYLSALKLADLVIGNSSSGLIEAPSLHTATVNIGDRQKGRIKAASVIDCDESSVSIIKAIEKALSEDFAEVVSATINPYGEGRAAEAILETIKKTDLNSLLRKPFYDVPFNL